MLKRTISLVLIMAFSLSNVGSAEDFKHLAPPSILDDIAEGTAHNKNIVLAQMHLGMELLKLKNMSDITGSRDAQLIISAFEKVRLSNVEIVADKGSRPSTIKAYFNVVDHIGGNIFRIPVSVENHDYSLLFSTDPVDGLFPVVFCTDEQLAAVRARVAQQNRLPQWPSEGPVSAKKAQEIYAKHELYDSEVIAWAHREENEALFEQAFELSKRYPEFVPEILHRAGIDLSTNDKNSLLGRECYIGIITPDLKERLERYKLTVPLENGELAEVIGSCHSSNKAIHIFITEAELKALSSSGQQLRGALNLLKQKIVHEIGVMLGCPAQKLVGMPGHRRPFNLIDFKYENSFIGNGKTSEIFSVVNLDTNLRTRDTATGTAGNISRSSAEKQLAALIENATSAGFSEVIVSTCSGSAVYYMDAANRTLFTYSLNDLANASGNPKVHLMHYSQNQNTRWIVQTRSEEVRKLVEMGKTVGPVVPEVMAVLEEKSELPRVGAKGDEFAKVACAGLTGHKSVIADGGWNIAIGANEWEALFRAKVTRSAAEVSLAEEVMGGIVYLTDQDLGKLVDVEDARQRMQRGEALKETEKVATVHVKGYKKYFREIEELRKQLYSIGREMASRRLLDGPGGNISACTKDRRFMVVKASGKAPEIMQADEYVVVDLQADGIKVVEGFGPILKPSVEAGFHKAIYLNRTDVFSVVHGHPIYSTAIATVSTPGPIKIAGITAEVLPYINAGRPELAKGVGEAIRHSDTLLLAKHGAITVADNLQTALQMTIELEDAAAGIVLNKMAFDDRLKAYNLAAAKLSELEVAGDKVVKNILAARNDINYLREELWMESEVVRLISLKDIKDGDVLCNLITKEVFRYNKSYQYRIARAKPGNFVVLRPLTLTRNARDNRDRYVRILRNSKSRTTRTIALKALALMVERGILPVPIETNDVFQHCHSTYSHSPGNTPQYIAWKGYILGLLVTGIVDHDTIAGFSEFRESASIVGLRNPTCGYEQRSIAKGTPFEHMETNSPGNIGETYVAFHGVARSSHEIQEEKIIPAKIERFKKTAAYLNDLGIISARLDYNRHIKPLTEAGNPTEKHVAEALARLIYENFAQDIARDEWSNIVKATNGFIAACNTAVGEVKDASITENDLGAVKDLTQFTFLIRNRVVTILKRVDALMPAEKEVMDARELYRDAHDNKELIYYCYLGGENPCAAESRKNMSKAQREAFLDRDNNRDKLSADLIARWLEPENASILHLWLAYQRSIGADGIAFMPNRNTPEEILDVMKIARECGFTRIANGMDVNTPTMPYTYFDYSNEQDFVAESLSIVRHESDARAAILLERPSERAVAILELIVRSKSIKKTIRETGFFNAEDLSGGWEEVFGAVKVPGKDGIRRAMSELEAMHIVRKELHQNGLMRTNCYYLLDNNLADLLERFKGQLSAMPARAVTGRSADERIDDFLTAFAISGPLWNKVRTGGFLLPELITRYEASRTIGVIKLPELPKRPDAVGRILMKMCERGLAVIVDDSSNGNRKFNLTAQGMDLVKEKMRPLPDETTRREPESAPAQPVKRATALQLSTDQKIDILAALSMAVYSASSLPSYRDRLSAVLDRELVPAQLIKKYLAIGRIDVRMGKKPDVGILHNIARGRHGLNERIGVYAALAELDLTQTYRDRACEILKELLKIELNTAQKIKIYLALAKFGPQAEKARRMVDLRDIAKYKIGIESDRIDCYIALAELDAGRKGRDITIMLNNRLEKLDRERASGRQQTADELSREIRIRGFLVNGDWFEERSAHRDRLNEMLGIAPSPRIQAYKTEGTVLIASLVQATGIPQKIWLKEFEAKAMVNGNILLGEALEIIARVGQECIIASRSLNGGTVSDPARLEIATINKNSNSRGTLIFRRSGETNNWKVEAGPDAFDANARGFGWKPGSSVIDELLPNLVIDALEMEYPLAVHSYAEPMNALLNRPPAFDAPEAFDETESPDTEGESSARQGGAQDKTDADRSSPETPTAGVGKDVNMKYLIDHKLLNVLIKQMLSEEGYVEEENYEDVKICWFGYKSGSGPLADSSFADIFEVFVQRIINEYGTLGPDITDFRVKILQQLIKNAGLKYNVDEKFVEAFLAQLSLQFEHFGIESGTVFIMNKYKKSKDMIVKHAKLERIIHQAAIEQIFNNKINKYRSEWRGSWRRLSMKIQDIEYLNLDGERCRIHLPKTMTYNAFAKLAHKKAEEACPISGLLKIQNLQRVIAMAGQLKNRNREIPPAGIGERDVTDEEPGITKLDTPMLEAIRQVKAAIAEYSDFKNGMDDEKLLDILSKADCKMLPEIQDGKAVLIFSPGAAFGQVLHPGTPDEKWMPGIAPFLPKISAAGIKVAVVVTDNREAEIIKELDRDTPVDRKITVGVSKDTTQGIIEIKTQLKVSTVDAARFYYYNVDGEPGSGDERIPTITLVAEQIIRAIGKVCEISGIVIEQMHEAAKAFARAA
jgi:L-fuculose-phosphate aldolase